jgi:hypothetical protein
MRARAARECGDMGDMEFENIFFIGLWSLLTTQNPPAAVPATFKNFFRVMVPAMLAGAPAILQIVICG